MVMASRVLFPSYVALSPLLGSLGFLNKILSVSVDCLDKRSQVLICWLSILLALLSLSCWSSSVSLLDDSFLVLFCFETV